MIDHIPKFPPLPQRLHLAAGGIGDAAISQMTTVSALSLHRPASCCKACYVMQRKNAINSCILHPPHAIPGMATLPLKPVRVVRYSPWSIFRYEKLYSSIDCPLAHTMQLFFMCGLNEKNSKFSPSHPHSRDSNPSTAAAYAPFFCATA